MAIWRSRTLGVVLPTPTAQNVPKISRAAYKRIGAYMRIAADILLEKSWRFASISSFHRRRGEIGHESIDTPAPDRDLGCTRRFLGMPIFRVDDRWREGAMA